MKKTKARKSRRKKKDRINPQEHREYLFWDIRANVFSSEQFVLTGVMLKKVLPVLFSVSQIIIMQCPNE